MKINDDYDWQGETALTLDAYHLKEVEDALAELDRLEKGAIPAPWKMGETYITKKDVAFVYELRNKADRLIFQCRNITAIVSDLDGVHHVLGSGYADSATAGVRKLSNECARLRAQNRELKKQVVEAENHARLWGHWCAVLTRRLNWFRDLFRKAPSSPVAASENQGGVE